VLFELLLLQVDAKLPFLAPSRVLLTSEHGDTAVGGSLPASETSQQGQRPCCAIDETATKGGTMLHRCEGAATAMKSRTKVPRYESFSPSSQASSEAKKNNRAKDTRAELILRRAVWRDGLRYRLHRTDLPGKPDIVFPRDRVVVFCDGDFWHGRDWRQRGKKLASGANAEYWVAKIQRNRERDREHNAALRRAGWFVVRLWETDILAAPEAAAALVRGVVLARRESSA
jgi:DNA mismatch endonuclease, patch repair protein